MLGLLAVTAFLVVLAGGVVLGIVVSGNLRRDLRKHRTVIVASSLAAILIGGGAASLLTHAKAEEKADIVERIEATYGVTVNEAGAIHTKDVRRWTIDGNLVRCFFTSSDMNDKKLMLFCKHWDADDSAEFVTPEQPQAPVSAAT